MVKRIQTPSPLRSLLRTVCTTSIAVYTTSIAAFTTPIAPLYPFLFQRGECWCCVKVAEVGIESCIYCCC
jgi:hypothetical protein